MAVLHNAINRKELQQRLLQEGFRRITISTYRYIHIAEPRELRDELYAQWAAWRIFGRVYLANEGFNAQMSVPEHYYALFRQWYERHPVFQQAPIKEALEDDGKSFYKLDVKVRPKLVNDSLPEGSFDPADVGRHLTARQFNEALNNPDTVTVDVRNFYEVEVGRFEGAIHPDAMSFREGVEKLPSLLKGREESNVLLYCTGGIRCEKASAYLKSRGFKDVNQLHGGIIDYTRQVKREGLENHFVGKNFVFDQRMGERVSDDVLGKCHQCGNPSDVHRNCANDICHVLFIQCETCFDEFQGCCCSECLETHRLPEVERIQLRKLRRQPPGHRRGDKIVRFSVAGKNP